jgi:hypothetical protein
MDEDTRERIAARRAHGRRRLLLGTPGAGQVAQEAVERALGRVPDPVAERVRLHRDGSVLVELVAETRLFTVRATGDEEVHVVVRLDARRLDDGMVDAEMEQRGDKRSSTFRLGEESISVEGRTLTELEGGWVDDDERFAEAWASRLGWAPTDAT